MKLYIFDVDGTIAPAGWGDDNGDPREPYLHVKAWFNHHYEESIKVAFASNQGGVGYRRLLEFEGKNVPDGYPTETIVYDRMRTLSRKLAGDADAIVAAVAFNFCKDGQWAVEYDESAHADAWNPEWRKPAPGMLKHLSLGYHDALFVGDREEDELAARAAGINFMWANDFFGKSSNG